VTLENITQSCSNLLREQRVDFSFASLLISDISFYLWGVLSCLRLFLELSLSYILQIKSELRRRAMELNINVLFNRVIKLIFAVILLALIIALIIGCGKLFLGIWITIAAPGITGRYLDIITDVLTLFVLVELSKSLVDYFHANRLRMTFIVDAAIVFLIREVMILVFQHKANPADIYAISALLLVLTVLRLGSILLFQRELSIVKATASTQKLE